MPKELLEQKANATQYAPLTLIKLLSLKRSKEKNFFSTACFDNITLARKNDLIVYSGKITHSSRISGIIYPNGKGEEIVIICDRLVNYYTGSKRRHKIKKYKTLLNHNELTGDYFTKSCLQNLVRIRIL